MKRKIYAAAVFAGALAISACGKKADVAQSTTAETTAAEETTQAASAVSPEEIESAAEEAQAELEDEGYFDGTVTGMAGTQVTVLSDDGESYTFDLANAEKDPDYEVLPGAYIEVSYDGAKNQGGVTEATMVSVLMSLEQQAMEKGEDPALQGTVKSYADGELVVTDPNGEDHTFDSSIAQIASETGLAAGAQVMVTYVGSIDEDVQEDNDEGSGSGVPVAIKVVTPDSVGTASANRMSGTVTFVDGGHMMIDTAAIPFEFTGDASLFAGLAEGDEVTVTYTGSVGNKTIQATAVEKK
ncbi:MAG: hypothetical protein Q4C63_01440 [Eubacteriales bacterium]|nr:hypothetical protein [Eubacteriales bacterium]